MISSNLVNSVLAECGSSSAMPPALIGSVVIDSRIARKGDMFLCFKGEKVDPHQFATELCEKGVYCVGTEPLEIKENYFKVNDIQSFLTLLAGGFRKAITPRIIAVTGSSGKTSTRELIKTMLKNGSKIMHGTSGNLNNHIGMPLTILNKPLVCSHIVLEMGMNHANEIKALVEIAVPHAVLITNIGYAHIGNFDSRESLAKAKLEIFDYSHAKILANIDDEFISEWVKKNAGNREIVTYSAEGGKSDISIDIKDNKVSGIRWKTTVFPVNTLANTDQLPEFVIKNFIASACAAISEGVDSQRLFSALENAVLPKFRGEKVRIGQREFTVDCYNANPDSMKKSIESFVRINTEKKQGDIYLLIGEMGELGKFSDFFHRELVNYIKNFNMINKTFLIGNEFEKVFKDFFDDKKMVFCRNLDEMAALIPDNGYFLLKGSRSNKMELLLEKIGGK